jgi:hypothetical protein
MPKGGIIMKKTYLIIALLAISLFIGACTKAPEQCIQPSDLQNVCKGYCEALTPSTPTAPPAVPNTPPPTVQEPVVPDMTSFLPPIPNVGSAYINRAENSVAIEFRNDNNFTITLPLTGSASKASKTECLSPIVTAVYKGEAVQALVTQIKSGDTFTVKWDCENPQVMPLAGSTFSGDLVFNYKTTAGMIKQQYGTVNGKYI